MCIRDSGISGTAEVEFVSVQSFIYPNPTEGQAWLNLDKRITKPSKLLVYDALGQVVSKEELVKGQKVFPLDLYSLSSGMYFYNIQQEGAIIGEGKLVKSN